MCIISYQLWLLKLHVYCIPMLIFLIAIVTESDLRGRAEDLELARDSLIL